LMSDPRFRVFEAIRQTDSPLPAGEADLFQFDKQAYDVVILGDLSAKRLTGGDLRLLDKLEEWVLKGGGLLMTGGVDALVTATGKTCRRTAGKILIPPDGSHRSPPCCRSKCSRRRSGIDKSTSRFNWSRPPRGCTTSACCGSLATRRRRANSGGNCRSSTA